MRILIIRHADPDYRIDSLTPTGVIEADLLAKRLVKENIRDFYVSPMGRAKRTAMPTLEALGREAKTLAWLEEYPSQLDVNESAFLQKSFPDTPMGEDGTYKKRISWDMIPSAWKNDPAYYEQEKWQKLEIAENSQVIPARKRVCEGFDTLMAEHGYIRQERLYITEQGNNDTIALFCHFGVQCIMLSHIWGVSEHVLLHGLCMAPSSVTEVYTEEREKGIVSLRAARIGDISHLYAADTKPSFAARFCEVYENEWERH